MRSILQVLGVMAWGLGTVVQGLGFRVRGEGVGCRVLNSGFRVTNTRKTQGHLCVFKSWDENRYACAVTRAIKAYISSGPDGFVEVARVTNTRKTKCMSGVEGYCYLPTPCARRRPHPQHVPPPPRRLFRLQTVVHTSGFRCYGLGSFTVRGEGVGYLVSDSGFRVINKRKYLATPRARCRPHPQHVPG